MALRRPTSLLVFGILHLTFGTLGLLGSLCGGLVMLSGVRERLQQWQEDMAATAPAPQKETLEYQARSVNAMEHSPLYRENMVIGGAGTVVLSVLLLAGGLGLVRMRPWARPVSLGYAALSLLLQAWQFVHAFVFFLPALNTFYEEEKGHTTDPGLLFTINLTQWTLYLTPVLSVIYLVYPTLVLIWMLRPAVAQALRRGGVENPDHDDAYRPDRANHAAPLPQDRHGEVGGGSITQ
jgi:hypothetical protein